MPHCHCAIFLPGRVSEKLEDLETRLEEKDEAREKAILDLKKDNFNLCEEIRLED